MASMNLSETVRRQMQARLAEEERKMQPGSLLLHHSSSSLSLLIHPMV
jgi:hypothetical protein